MTERTRGVARSKFGLIGSLAGFVVLLAIINAAVMPATAPAQVKRCGNVIKKLYSSPRAEFYKAKVLVVRGQAPCGEARRVIWRALRPGGYWGGINGWQCVPKGHEPHIAKCSRVSAGGTTVIKSSKPRYCRGCRRNSKRARTGARLQAAFAGQASISKIRWRRCGRVHYWRGQFMRVESRPVRCGLARKVIRGLIADVVRRRHPCPGGVCTVLGFTCNLFAKGPPGAQDCRKGRQVAPLRGKSRRQVH